MAIAGRRWPIPFRFRRHTVSGFLAVGTLASNAATGLTTLAHTNGAIGNCLILGTKLTSTSITITSVTGGGATNWVKIAGPNNDGTRTQELWMGTVNATGAQTITVNFSGSVSALAVDLDAQEFSSPLGSSAVWTADTSGWLSNSASTTITYPTLAPTNTPTELYVGQCRIPGGASYTGLTAGFTGQTDVNGNRFIYNLAVTSSVSPSESNATNAANATLAALITDVAGSVNGTLTLASTASFTEVATQIAPNTFTGASIFTANAAQQSSVILTAASGFTKPVWKAANSTAQTLGHTEPEVKLFGGTYYCYYRDDSLGHGRINLMTSTDGATWTEQGNLIDVTASAWDSSYCVSPSVEFDGSTYYLFYEGNNGSFSAVGYATATSPLGPFTKFGSNPILSKQGAGFESVLVGTPSVILIGGTWYLFYHGYDGTHDQVALAWATSPSGTWSRHPSNPILPVGNWFAGKIAPSNAILINGMVFVFVEGDPGTGKWAIGVAEVPLAAIQTASLSLDDGSLYKPMLAASLSGQDNDYVQLPDIVSDGSGGYWLYYSGHSSGGAFRLFRTNATFTPAASVTQIAPDTFTSSSSLATSAVQGSSVTMQAASTFTAKATQLATAAFSVASSIVLSGFAGVSGVISFTAASIYNAVVNQLANISLPGSASLTESATQSAGLSMPAASSFTAKATQIATNAFTAASSFTSNAVQQAILALNSAASITLDAGGSISGVIVMAANAAWQSNAVQTAVTTFSGNSSLAQTATQMASNAFNAAGSLTVKATQQALLTLSGTATTVLSGFAGVSGTIVMTASSVWQSSAVQNVVTTFSPSASLTAKATQAATAVFASNASFTGKVVHGVKGAFSAAASFIGNLATGILYGQSSIGGSEFGGKPGKGNTPDSTIATGNSPGSSTSSSKLPDDTIGGKPIGY